MGARVRIYHGGSALPIRAYCDNYSVHEEEIGAYDVVRLSFNGEDDIPVPVGSYIELEGIKYRTFEAFYPKQNGMRDYRYTVEFMHPVMFLTRIPYFHLQGDTTSWESADKESEWSYSGYAATLVEGAVAYLNRFLDTIRDGDEMEDLKHTWSCLYDEFGQKVIDLSVSAMDIVSVISEAADQCGCEFHFDFLSKTLYFGNVGSILAHGEEAPSDDDLFVFQSGYNVTHANIVSPNGGDYYNRYIVRGGTTNLSQPSYMGGNVRVTRRLTLPDGYPDSIIDLRGNADVPVAIRADASEPPLTGQITIDDVWPKLRMYVYGVRERRCYKLDGDGNETEDIYSKWYIKLAYRTTEQEAGKTAIKTEEVDGTTCYWYQYVITDDMRIMDVDLQLSFIPNYESGLSSPLAGRTFQIVTFDEETQENAHNVDGDFTVEPGEYRIEFEEDSGFIIPSTKAQGLYPREADEAGHLPSTENNIVSVIGVVVTDEMKAEARSELLQEAIRYITDLRKDKNAYTFDSYVVKFKRYRENGTLPRVGQRVIYDDGGSLKGLQSYRVVTKVRKMTTHLTDLNNIRIDVGNEKIVGRRESYEKKVDTLITYVGGSTDGSMSDANFLSLLYTYGSKYFLSKTKGDTAQGIITFLKGILFGAAQKWSIDGDGRAILNTINAQEAIFKKLTAQEAHFFTLIIDEIKSVGGQLIITPANCRIDKVEGVSGGYKCYFKKTDGSRTINNQWQVGMQAIHQEFNVSQGGTRNYWRVVTGIGEESEVQVDENNVFDCHYIILGSNNGEYKNDSRFDSTFVAEPQAGDDLSQLGFNEEWYKSTHNGTLPENVGDLENAIVISAYNIPFIDMEAFRDNQPTKAPLYVSYRNINSFNVGASNRVAVIAGNGNYLSAVLRIENDSTLADGREINDLGITEGNLVRNSGFTGDYESEEVGEDGDVSADTIIYSDPLKHWESKNVEVNSIDDATITDEDYKARIEKSVSGSVAIINNGSLKQQIESGISKDTWYVLSFKACCPDTTDTTLNVSLGGVSNAVTVYNSVQRVDLPFKSTAADSMLTFQATSKVMLMDVMLIRGNIPSEYQKSEKDNDKSVAKFLGLSYLQRAITEASTEILGGLILTQLVKVGMYRDKQFTQETGGMSGLYIDEHSPFLYGGGTLEQAIYTAMKYSNPRYMPDDAEVAEMAKFVVTHGGRAILNDICLRGYIYALGGVFRNVQSVDGKWSLDENGIMKCMEAWISGSIYTPYTIINNNNIGDYTTTREITIRSWSGYRLLTVYELNLEQSGLNVQIDYSSSANLYIALPNEERYVGAEINIFANNPCAVCGVAMVSPANMNSYTTFNPVLKKGQKVKLKCFNDNGTFRWIVDSYSDSMRFRAPIMIACVHVSPSQNEGVWSFWETFKNYHATYKFTYERVDDQTGMYRVTLPADWTGISIDDLLIIPHTGLNYEQNGPVYAAVIDRSVSGRSFTVRVADDASPNDGDFGFSLYLNRDFEAIEYYND